MSKLSVAELLIRYGKVVEERALAIKKGDFHRELDLARETVELVNELESRLA